MPKSTCRNNKGVKPAKSAAGEFKNDSRKPCSVTVRIRTASAGQTPRQAKNVASAPASRTIGTRIRAPKRGPHNASSLRLKNSYPGKTVAPYHAYPARVGASPRKSSPGPLSWTSLTALVKRLRPAYRRGSVCCNVLMTSMGTRATCVNVHANAPATVKSVYTAPPSGRSRTSGGTRGSCGASGNAWADEGNVPACSSKARPRRSRERACALRKVSGEAESRRSAGSSAAGSRHHSVSGIPSAARRRAALCDAMMAFLKPAKSTSPSLLASASPNISRISSVEIQLPKSSNASPISLLVSTPLPSVSITRNTSINSSRSVLNSCSKNESLSIDSGSNEKHSFICCGASNGKRPPKRLINAAASAPARPFQLRESVPAKDASKRAKSSSGDSSETAFAPVHHIAHRSSRDKSNRERYDVNAAG
mmetsp:Transcript_41608/g.115817  ORF Transcript_41608/g.115817 Transcript_41608/m.115817 type:complete len:422 (+) Transcript_41608:574-1839(+)